MNNTCDLCHEVIEGTVIRSSHGRTIDSVYHDWCAWKLEDSNLDYMAFMDDAREYAISKGE